MRNTIKDLNLTLNHDPSYHFNINIKMTENIKFDTTIDKVATLCINKLDTSKNIDIKCLKKRIQMILLPKMFKSYTDIYFFHFMLPVTKLPCNSKTE